MTEEQIPRVMIAGTNSGCGKTTITCGILAALKKRKILASSCKCGPDYIDPMFHREIFGIPSKNLDLFFTDLDMTKYLMMKNTRGTDITVIEGVMGFYDGMQMDSAQASSYDLAKKTDTPVILVINGKGMALSVLSIIKGFLELYKDHTIKGVILNNVSKMTGQYLTEIIERELMIKVYGCIPVLKDMVLTSRHLGLVTPYELEHIQQDMERLGEIAEENLLLDEILALSKEAKPVSTNVKQGNLPQFQNSPGRNLHIAVAHDKAFCFYYQDNLEFLKEAGCELIFFSPLQERELPAEIDGLLLGGGYPEIYGKELSENHSMRQSIKTAILKGLPCMAECGGFMYLHEELEDQQGMVYPMVGIIKGHVRNQGRLVHFGYIFMESKTDNSYMEKGESIKAHEFHYWDSSNNGTDFLAQKPSKKIGWECMHAHKNLLAGFPHLYYYSNQKLPMNFLKICREYQKARRSSGEAS